MIKRIGVWAVSLILVLVTSCGGSQALVDAAVDLAGIWTITETVESTTPPCDEMVGIVTTITLEIIQNGNDLTMTVEEEGGTTFTGTISGNTVTWSGNAFAEGGTMNMSADATATENNLSGTISWQWSSGEVTCSGTSTITGTRN